MRDQMSQFHPVVAVQPGTTTSDNTPIVSSIIDVMGFGSLTFLILLGALADADATFSVKWEHGNAANLSDATEATENDMCGTLELAGFTAADDGKARKIGYCGNKRFHRITITPAGNAAAANVAVLALLGLPSLSPTPNPPA